MPPLPPTDTYRISTAEPTRLARRIEARVVHVRRSQGSTPMDLFDTQPATPVEVPRSSTISALLLLAVFAVIVSYLVAYAGANALAATDMIPRWTSGTDPRPRWFGNTFAILMAGFIFIGGIARFLSWRQLRNIDRMQEGV